MTAADLTTTDLELIRAAARGVVGYLGHDFYINGVQASAVEAHAFRDLIGRELLVQHGPIIQATADAERVLP